MLLFQIKLSFISFFYKLIQIISLGKENKTITINYRGVDMAIKIIHIDVSRNPFPTPNPPFEKRGRFIVKGLGPSIIKQIKIIRIAVSRNPLPKPKTPFEQRGRFTVKDLGPSIIKQKFSNPPHVTNK